jgi:hypothetical protein
MFSYYLNGVARSDKDLETFTDKTNSDVCKEVAQILDAAMEELVDQESHGEDSDSESDSDSDSDSESESKSLQSSLEKAEPDKICAPSFVELMDKVVEVHEEASKFKSICSRLRSIILSFFLCKKTEVRDFVGVDVDIKITDVKKNSERKEE